MSDYSVVYQKLTEYYNQFYFRIILKRYSRELFNSASILVAKREIFLKEISNVLSLGGQGWMDMEEGIRGDKQ